MKKEAEEWFKKGSYASESGYYDEAIRYYKKTIEIDPDNADAHIKLGAAYYRKDMFVEAVIEFKQAVALDPDNADARISMRHAYDKKTNHRCFVGAGQYCSYTNRIKKW
jgi:tetratricopeptide (TPR) repeat protein